MFADPAARLRNVLASATSATQVATVHVPSRFGPHNCAAVVTQGLWLMQSPQWMMGISFLCDSCSFYKPIYAPNPTDLPKAFRRTSFRSSRLV